MRRHFPAVRRSAVNGKRLTQAGRYIRRRNEEQDQTEPWIEQEAHYERCEHPDAHHLWLHQWFLQRHVCEVRDLPRPLKDPIEVVERNEMIADRTRGRDRMLPAGDLAH